MNCLRRNRATKDEASQYANLQDFCHLFTENIDRFYGLALLLTGEQQKAEQCLVAGMDDCFKAKHVFKEWADSWAKRSIIRNAIRELEPGPPRGCESGSHYFSEPPSGEKAHFGLERVLTLEDFERFVFVMSVLEHYSAHDCAVLLSCSRQEVRDAGTRALMRLATSSPMELSAEINFEHVQGLSR